MSHSTTLKLNDTRLACMYCKKRTSGKLDENTTKCSECNLFSHWTCVVENVDVTDYSLLGDVFYKFTCKTCSVTGEELVLKEKISWLTALVLTLYNLQEQIYLSRHGFFHWKMHICDFIDRRWNSIFGHSVRRKRTWRGTVSGTLSHYSPAFFQTGTEILREPGWWRLTHINLPPFRIVQLRSDPSIQIQLGRRCSLKDVGGEDNIVDEGIDHPLSSSSTTAQDSFSLASDRDCNSPRSAIDLDMLSYSDSEGLDVDIDLDLGLDIEDKPFESSGFPRLDSEFSDLISQYVTSEEIIPFSPEYTEHTSDVKEAALSDAGTDRGSTCDSDEELTGSPPPKSLLSSAPKRLWPWKSTSEVPPRNNKERFIAMTEYEELNFLQRLASHVEKPQKKVPKQVQRLYRKLCIRQEQRHRRLDTFSSILGAICGTESQDASSHQSAIRTLDRYQVDNLVVRWTEGNHKFITTQQPFILRLLGWVEPICFVSPFTERLLRPFIRRDYESQPLWLRLMAEIRSKVREGPMPHYSIDYCYVRPQHIPVVNALCSLFFWPGIDLTECLHYPDFSCVALYRKLVIGFAFMVPDARHNESYISFLFTRPEWRRAGIATFMLYHLIQTCMGKDITLHVSVTNPAIILYQKFGFKVEELAQDFYDKYFPADSKECKHALFLRLSR